MKKLFAIGAAASLAILDAQYAYAADPSTPVNATNTASPIKHVIIIVRENRSFDHLFARICQLKNR
jgi:phospholipase C